MAVSCGRGFCGVENCDEQLSHPLWFPFWRPQEKAGRRIDDRLVCEPMPFQEAIPFVSVCTLQGHGKSTLSFCSAVNTVQILLLAHAMMTPLLTVAAARSHATS